MTVTLVRHCGLALAVVLAVSACSGGKGDAISGLSSDLPRAETVNGEAVPLLLLELLAKERNLDLAEPAQRAQALNELTDYVLLAQAARKENYAADPQFAAEVELNRLQGVANATVTRFRSDVHVDDSVLETEYQQQLERAGNSEYDFSQLLFDSEDEALAVAGEAVDKPFNEVFDEWGKKAKQARAFSRVRLSQLPEPLAKVLATLKSGETSKLPVHTDFGWHVVHVGAVSPFTPPPFEQVKESIRATLSNQLAEQRMAKLRADADVQLVAPVSKPTRAADAAAAESTP